MAAQKGDLVTLAEGFNLHTFADAFRFLWNDHSLLTTKALEQLQLSAIAIGAPTLGPKPPLVIVPTAP